MATRGVSAVQTFRALGQRDFRLVWTSTILSGGAQQMEWVVMAWFVLQLTDSPFMVGLATFARMLGTGLAPLAGAVADRMARRLLLLSVQAVLAILALAMVLLLVTGLLEVWHIFALAFLGGLARIFDQPARQALMADSVPDDQISNAVALNVAGMNVTQVAGPLLAGALFKVVGPAGAYGAIALLNLAGLVAVFGVQAPPNSRPAAQESVWGSMVQGLRYVRRRDILIAALLMAAIANLTGFPSGLTLTPVFARDILHTDSAGLGALLSAVGIGALVGSIALASTPRMEHTGKLLIGAMVAWHVANLLAFNSGSFERAWTLFLLSGVAQSVSMVLIAVLLLEIAPPELRGRVMGLRMLAVYPLPFGSLVSGALATGMGVPATAIVFGIAGVALIAALAASVPNLRRPQRWEEMAHRAAG